MKLSVSIWCIYKEVMNGRMNTLDFIKLCHKNGVKYVEILNDFVKDNEVDDIKKLLKEYNMQISSYSISNDFVQKSQVERQKQVFMVKSCIDKAANLGAKFMRVFSGEEKDGITLNQGTEYIVSCFKEISSYAEAKGVTMVLENHGLFVGKSNQVKELIEKVHSKCFLANVDTGNFFLAGEKPINAVKNLKNYIGFVHFKDFKETTDDLNSFKAENDKRYIGTVLGLGDTHMKEIADFLYENGYDGFLSIEFEGPGDQIRDTISSIEYTKSIIK